MDLSGLINLLAYKLEDVVMVLQFVWSYPFLVNGETIGQVTE